jgi:hypothetical protein
MNSRSMWMVQSCNWMNSVACTLVMMVLALLHGQQSFCFGFIVTINLCFMVLIVDCLILIKLVWQSVSESHLCKSLYSRSLSHILISPITLKMTLIFLFFLLWSVNGRVSSRNILILLLPTWIMLKVLVVILLLILIFFNLLNLSSSSGNYCILHPQLPYLVYQNMSELAIFYQMFFVSSISFHFFASIVVSSWASW